MISLKRNSKGELTEATGIRVRQDSMYKPNQAEPFKVSRSKFSDFLSCRRCFYLDRVKGLISPSLPGWTLNETTDLLLKKEFDLCRKTQVPHRLFEEYNLTHVVPFDHEDMELWRNSLRGGLQYKFKNSNIVLQGGIDDLWFDRQEQKVIVVDYKSQANRNRVTTESYLAGTYHQGYKTQIDFYAYLLINMGFDVSEVGYFYVCNADRDADAFEGRMVFEETLVPYEWDIGWIDAKVTELISVLNSYNLPVRSLYCENCAYAYQRASIEVGI